MDIPDEIKEYVKKEIRKAMAFDTTKYGDTPTDALQLTPKKYVDSKGATPGGNNTEIQFNNNGVFDGDSNFYWDAANRDLYVYDSIYFPTTGNHGFQIGTYSTNNGDSITIFTGGHFTSVPGLYGNNSIYSGPGDGTGDSGQIRLITETASGTNKNGVVRIMPSNLLSSSYRHVGRLTTTGNTPTSELAVNMPTMPTDSAMFIQAKVTARRTSGSAGTAGDSAAYIRSACYKTIGGVTTLVGAIQDGLTAEDQAAWDASFAISTNDILLQVTGATNNNITWQYEIVYIVVTT